MRSTHFETFLDAVADTPVKERDGILGNECLIYPPSEDYGYDATPRNAITFGAMGCDGVHYAILKINGAVGDDSPVIQIGPMDFSEPYVVLADCFVAYLADACGVPIREMESVFADQRQDNRGLVPFLKGHFNHSRLFNEGRLAKFSRYLEQIERRDL